MCVFISLVVGVLPQSLPLAAVQNSGEKRNGLELPEPGLAPELHFGHQCFVLKTGAVDVNVCVHAVPYEEL